MDRGTVLSSWFWRLESLNMDASWQRREVKGCHKRHRGPGGGGGGGGLGDTVHIKCEHMCACMSSP